MRNRDELFIPYSRRGNHDLGIRVDLRTVALLGLVITVLGLAGWLYLRQTSEAIALANEVRELQEKREALHRELIVLEGQVAMLGSLERVYQEGIAMGYTLRDASDANRVFITCEACSPLGTPLMGRSETTLPPPEERQELWKKIVIWLQTWLRPREP